MPSIYLTSNRETKQNQHLLFFMECVWLRKINDVPSNQPKFLRMEEFLFVEQSKKKKTSLQGFSNTVKIRWLGAAKRVIFSPILRNPCNYGVHTVHTSSLSRECNFWNRLVERSHLVITLQVVSRNLESVPAFPFIPEIPITQHSAGRKHFALLCWCVTVSHLRD